MSSVDYGLTSKIQAKRKCPELVAVQYVLFYTRLHERFVEIRKAWPHSRRAPMKQATGRMQSQRRTKYDSLSLCPNFANQSVGIAGALST